MDKLTVELQVGRIVDQIVVLIEEGFAKSPAPNITRDLHAAVAALILRHGHRCGEVTDAQLLEAVDTLTERVVERAVTRLA